MTAVPTLEWWEVVVRVVVAAALGGLIGFEREYRDQPAGFRTHILVSVGAALFTVAGAYGVEAFASGRAESVVRFDPTRVAAQVVTGIGFLGAGAIVRHGATIRGLTTAAALWVTAAIGLAVGLGYWTGAVAAALVTVVSLYGLKTVERRIFPRLRRGRFEFILDVDEDFRPSTLMDSVESHRGRMESMEMADEDEEGTRLMARMVLPPHLPPEILSEELLRLPGVNAVDYRT